MKKLLFAFVLLVLLAGCAYNEYEYTVTPITWQTITAQTARDMMMELDDFILLDVRTLEEFEARRIDGAILIPHNQILDRAAEELPDKNAVILVHCRSGQRSATAAAVLAGLGYLHVYDFGGIINWYQFHSQSWKRIF
ncbi:MAG: rhodanese-like domain-containing protein [Defluviitaleaceae bacterium]|nr:rhodanese-like domain-containing protein [Defluviitaleaceae bacterium]